MSANFSASVAPPPLLSPHPSLPPPTPFSLLLPLTTTDKLSVSSLPWFRKVVPARWTLTVGRWLIVRREPPHGLAEALHHSSGTKPSTCDTGGGCHERHLTRPEHSHQSQSWEKSARSTKPYGDRRDFPWGRGRQLSSSAAAGFDGAAQWRGLRACTACQVPVLQVMEPPVEVVSFFAIPCLWLPSRLSKCPSLPFLTVSCCVRPRGGLHGFPLVQGSAVDFPVSLGDADEGFFRTFPWVKKSAKVGARSRSELAAHSSSSTPGATPSSGWSSATPLAIPASGTDAPMRLPGRHHLGGLGRREGRGGWGLVLAQGHPYQHLYSSSASS